MSEAIVGSTIGHWVLKVGDTGKGINSDIIDRIFEPYFTTKGPEEGSGLGLAVVHGIVRSHGGAITVSSEPGVGTTFSVYLPHVENLRLSEDVHASHRAPGGRESILLVDDEEALMRVEKQMLEELGYRVTARASGMEALKAFHGDPEAFDLVITDQTMPFMTGMELARKLLEIRKDIPIILYSGFNEAVTIEKAGAVGIRAVMMKPLILSELAQAIRGVFD